MTSNQGAPQGADVVGEREGRLIEANEEAQRLADKFLQRAQRAEAEVEELTRESELLLRLMTQDRDSVAAQLEVYREALYAIQNEPSCSPVVHELAGNALAGEKP